MITLDMPDRRDDRPPRSEERNTLEDDKDSAAVMMSLITTVSEVGQSRGGANEEGEGRRHRRHCRNF